MSKLWLQNGKVVVDSTGRPILCDVCPCPTKCESMLTYLNTLYATYGGTLHGEGFLRRTTEGDDIIIIGQAALVYTMESVAMIAVVGCGEGDECEWTNQQLVAETDTWFDVSGVCACPGLVTMRLTAEANGYTYYQEGFYSPLRLRHVGDTAHKWDTRTLYRGAYWDGAKWVVMRCNCTTFNLLVPSGRDSTYYKFFEYPGACECLDVRRAIVENSTDFGVTDWIFGSNAIMSDGGNLKLALPEDYDHSGTPHYYNEHVFLFVEEDGNGYARINCIGASAGLSWSTNSRALVGNALLFELTPGDTYPFPLSLFGDVVVALGHNKNGMTRFYWSHYDTKAECRAAANAYAMADPGIDDIIYVRNRVIAYGVQNYAAANGPYGPKQISELTILDPVMVEDPDGIVVTPRRYGPEIYFEPYLILGAPLYIEQYTCSNSGALIRSGAANVYTESGLLRHYGLPGADPEEADYVDISCTLTADPACPGDDGAWKEEIE